MQGKLYYSYDIGTHFYLFSTFCQVANFFVLLPSIYISTFNLFVKKITITPFAEQRRYRVHGRPGSVSVIHILLLVSVVSITAHIAFLCHVQWGGSENAFFGLLTTALRIFFFSR